MVGNPQTSANAQVRLLLDSGSQGTYVTEQLVNDLGLVRGVEQEIKVVIVGSKADKLQQS